MNNKNTLNLLDKKSLASAAKSPATIISAGEPFLRSFGVTRQKATYFMNVARAIQSGGLDLEALAQLSDEIAIEKLTSVKGIAQRQPVCCGTIT